MLPGARSERSAYIVHVFERKRLTS